MKHLLFWLERWVPVAVSALAAPLFLPFSRAWRRKVQAAWLICANPYWDRVISLSELIDDPLSVQVAPLRAAEHNCSEYELLVLGALARQTRSKRVFEIGTYDGRTTRTLAANISEDGLVFTLNLPPDQRGNDAGLVSTDTLLNLKVRSGWRFSGTPEEFKIKQLYGDSATFEFGNYAGSFDLVFIDGSHSEDYVERDTQTALRLLRPEGGLVVWHDAPIYGVARYLRRKIREGNWPVRLVCDTSLMIGYARQGKWVELPAPLPA